MDREPNSALLDEWVGAEVYVRQLLGGEQIEAADLENLWANPNRLISIGLADTSSIVIFEDYDRFGITIRDRGEASRQSFVPWGAVLLIQGR